MVAVDVGYGQLAWRLQQDPRVLVRDRTNVRDLTLDLTGGPVDLVVADLSFISLRLVLPAWSPVSRTDEADLLLMVKPQFEVGRAAAAGRWGGARPGAPAATPCSVSGQRRPSWAGVRRASPPARCPGRPATSSTFCGYAQGSGPLDAAAVDRAIEEGPT